MLRRTLFALAGIAFALSVQAAPSVGQAAPDFSLKDASDSIASSDPEDIKKAVNYVRQGLGEALAGKPLTAAVTRPYGCSIHYKS